MLILTLWLNLKQRMTLIGSKSPVSPKHVNTPSQTNYNWISLVLTPPSTPTMSLTPSTILYKQHGGKKIDDLIIKKMVMHEFMEQK